MSIIHLPDGKQAIISSDLGVIRITLCANRGSLGIDLTGLEALEVAAMLMLAAKKAKASRK